MLYTLGDVVKEVAPNLPYHNFEHMQDVSNLCGIHGKLERVSPDKIFLLKSAGFVHDLIYVPGSKHNEETTVITIKDINMLPKIGYSKGEINFISRMIMATKNPTNPRDIYEMIICDSDLDHLGRDDFPEKSELLRIENGVDEATWYGESQPEFLKDFSFYTNSAKKLRGAKLEENKKIKFNF
ncbi:MAG: hypothetical protein KKB03_03930 [Nanoarchaeota archaeon]|nr:hypothetical protein [Nanoarchaeota archaeon]MBU1135852.1 hypothetical protein [Nanoarchaeota archaeon]MBU2520363.1 hypothetical protein [Nanoarchaeota archaeon]